MKKHVIKFGGSNFKSKESYQNILKAVKAYNGQLFIVVSAFYGVTEKLIDIINHTVKDPEKADILLTGIEKQTYNIINDYIANKELYVATLKEIDFRFKRLADLINCLKVMEEIPDFLYSFILSFGERISACTLNAILNQYNIHSKELLPENYGLFTDGDFYNASVNYDKSREHILKNIDSECHYVIPGFYGISEDRKITLLGRGGSDYSAAAFANILEVESLDIWKDVDGFKTADPKIIDNTLSINNLNYNEAAELAYFGAEILHPRTVEPVKELNIPVRFFNIENFTNPIHPVTVVNGNKHISTEAIKSITYSDNFAILKLKGPGVGNKPGVLAKATGILVDNGINIKSVITSQTTINLLLSKTDIFRAGKLINNLDLPTISVIETCENISVIALIGEGIIEQPGIAAKIFSSLANDNINVVMIAFGASDVAIYFIIDEKDRNKALQLTHDSFFKDIHQPVTCN